MEYYEKLLNKALNNDKSSIKELQSSAGSGVAEAQYYLAMYYGNTQGNDNPDCQYWMKKAVGNGYKSAEGFVVKEEKVGPVKFDDSGAEENNSWGSIFKKFSFMGRIGRKEYIISILIYLLLCFVVFQLSEPKLQMILRLLLDWFILSQAARRFHDFGESGWWVLVPVISWIWAIFPKSTSEEITTTDEISAMTEEETKDRINSLNFDPTRWDGSADSLPSDK